MCTLGIPPWLGFLYPVTVSTKTFVKWSCLHPPPSLLLCYWYLFLVGLFLSVPLQTFLCVLCYSAWDLCAQDAVPWSQLLSLKAGIRKGSPQLTNSTLFSFSKLSKHWPGCFYSISSFLQTKYWFLYFITVKMVTLLSSYTCVHGHRSCSIGIILKNYIHNCFWRETETVCNITIFAVQTGYK